MKILEMQSARLTNWEVLQRLEEYEAEHDGSDGTGRARRMPENLKEIIRDVKANLQHQESPLNSSKAGKYSNESIQALFDRLDAKYAFLTSEYMMFLNHRPQNVVELNVIVEDMDKRFTEEEQADILSIIKDVLGGEEDTTEEDDKGIASNSAEPNQSKA